MSFPAYYALQQGGLVKTGFCMFISWKLQKNQV
jgi:hypothetical protein